MKQLSLLGLVLASLMLGGCITGATSHVNVRSDVLPPGWVYATAQWLDGAVAPRGRYAGQFRNDVQIKSDRRSDKLGWRSSAQINRCAGTGCR